MAAHQSSPMSSPESSLSASPEPRSVTSANTSPGSQSSPLTSVAPMARTTKEHPKSRPGPYRTNSRTQNTGQGGCWTCRIRRKKCDEQHVQNSCATCLRLGIDCLGWGSTKPEWMKDKDAIESYKAEIKAQLSRAGLIRGQPRTPQSNPSSPPPQRFSPGSTSAVVPQQKPSPRQQLNSPHSQTSQGNVYAAATSYGESSEPQRSSRHTTTVADRFSRVPSQDFYHHRGQSPGPEPPKPPQESLETEHALYYFSHVRRLQYVFAGQAVTNTTYQLIVQNPQGAVTNAVCALASLHYNRMRVARGLAVPELHPNQSMAKHFSDLALNQLANARGRYTEADTIAALHLVSFAVLSGGTQGNWEQALSVPIAWVGQTGLLNGQDIRPTLLNMSVVARLALKTTMWIDVFSSLTLQRPPKHLVLYKNIVAAEAEIWATRMGEGYVPIRTEDISGCPEDIVLAIGDTSQLAHWRASELHRGTLSIRELAHRADTIEQRLRSLTFHHDVQASSTQFPGEDARRAVASIFRESAMLYLYTTVSDAYAGQWSSTASLALDGGSYRPSLLPGIREIRDSASAIVRMLGQLPISDVDRALAFPMAIAGCMSDDMLERNAIKSRLLANDSAIGNPGQVRMLLEAVWARRDAHGGAVDWRDMIRERGLNLLLI